MTIWIVLLCIGVLGPVSVEASAFAWLVVTAVRLVAGAWPGLMGPVMTTVLVIVFVPPVLVFALKPLHRVLITHPVLAVLRKIVPEMLQTEHDAVEVGTVWWDAELFSGRPN